MGARDTSTESVVEEAAPDHFRELGYAIILGPDIAPEEPGAERESFGGAVHTGGRLEYNDFGAACRRAGVEAP